MKYKIYEFQQAGNHGYVMQYKRNTVVFVDRSEMTTFRTSSLEKLVMRVQAQGTKRVINSLLIGSLVKRGEAWSIFECNNVEEIYNLKTTNPELFI